MTNKLYAIVPMLIATMFITGLVHLGIFSFLGTHLASLQVVPAFPNIISATTSTTAYSTLNTTTLNSTTIPINISNSTPNDTNSTNINSINSSNSTILNYTTGNNSTTNSIIKTNLTANVTPPVIFNSGSVLFNGKVWGGSGNYIISWSVTGLDGNNVGLTWNSSQYQLNAPSCGCEASNSLNLTKWTIIGQDQNGNPFNLTDGNYSVKFTVSDSKNLSDSNSSAINLYVDNVSTSLSGNSIINWSSPGQGTLIDAMNTVTENQNQCTGAGWCIYYGVPTNAFSNSIEVNTTTWVEGGSSVSFTLPPNGTVAIFKTVNLNLKNAANFYYWFYIQNSSELINNPKGSYGVSLQFINTSQDVASCYIFSSAIQNGWTPILIARSACNADPGFWTTNVIQIEFSASLDPSVTHNVTVNIDNLRENYGGGLFNKAQVILTFDGSWNSTLFNATPILQQNHQTGVAYIVTNQINEGGNGGCGVGKCITANQLTTLYNDGWTIASHTTDHADLVNRTADALNAIITTNDPYFDSYEVANSFKTLSLLGFGATGPRNTAQFFAYPNGAYNAVVISNIVSPNNYTIARALNLGITQPNLYPNDPYNLSYRVQSVVMTPDNPDSNASFVSYANTVIGYTNNAIPQNGLLILTFHIIQKNPLTTSCESAGTCYPTALFKNISNYLANEQCAGLLQVTNFSAYQNVLTTGTGGNTGIPTWCTPSISILPNTANIEVGQSVTFTNITNNGLAPFAYSYITNAANTVISGNTITFLSAGTYKVSESATGRSGITGYSANAIITVGAGPTISLSPTTATIDAGQSITFANTTNGGTEPYTYSYATNAPSNTFSGNKATFSTAGSYYVYESVTDNSGLTSNSANSIIAVNSTPTLSAPLATSGTIDQGQGVGFNTTVTGGTGPFTLNLVNTSTGITVEQLTGQKDGLVTFPGIDISNTGTYTFNITATDAANYIFNSTKITIIVNPTPIGNSQGGGGGGGGGSSVPTVSYVNGCALISGVSVPDSFSFHVGNQQFTNVFDNYIGANYTSVVVNGVTYILNLNTPTLVNGSMYMNLLNVSYLPIVHTVEISACANSSVNTTYNFNLTGNITSQSNKININLGGVPLAIVSVNPSNLSSLISLGNTFNIPAAPNPLAIYSAVNISISNLTNATINVTAKFQCGLNGIQPYILENGTWVQINPFTVNEGNCTVNFAIKGDPIVALIYQPAITPPIQKPSSPNQPGSTSIPIVQIFVQGTNNSNKDIVAGVLVLAGIMALIGGSFAMSRQKANAKKKGNRYASYKNKK